jgi:hypothetical protein
MTTNMNRAMCLAVSIAPPLEHNNIRYTSPFIFITLFELCGDRLKRAADKTLVSTILTKIILKQLQSSFYYPSTHVHHGQEHRNHRNSRPRDLPGQATSPRCRVQEPTQGDDQPFCDLQGRPKAQDLPPLVQDCAVPSSSSGTTSSVAATNSTSKR